MNIFSDSTQPPLIGCGNAVPLPKRESEPFRSESEHVTDHPIAVVVSEQLEMDAWVVELPTPESFDPQTENAKGFGKNVCAVPIAGDSSLRNHQETTSFCCFHFPPDATPQQRRVLRRHAMTIIQHHQLSSSRTLLVQQCDALTSQVMRDFEELSLVRALATNAFIVSDGCTSDSLVRKILGSLADTIGAQHLCMVGQAEDDAPSRIRWCPRNVETDAASRTVERPSEDDVREMILRHTTGPKTLPFLSNQYPSTPCGDSSGGRDAMTQGRRANHHVQIDQVILVACAVDGIQHGWLIALNAQRTNDTGRAWSQPGFTSADVSMMQTAAARLAGMLQNQQLMRDKEQLFTDVVQALVNAVEARDQYTCGHSQRVAAFGRALAMHLGLTEKDCQRIYLTGLLHDVGKIAIPDEVLQKKGKLNQEERKVIETHPVAGWQILHKINALQEVLPGVLHHHEQFDGNGYPHGLSGTAIPLDGRLLAVCDAFDAMTSDRPYRAGMPVDQTLQILRDGAGTHWDPVMIDAFLEISEEIDVLRIRLSRPDPPLTQHTAAALSQNSSTDAAHPADSFPGETVLQINSRD